ncbi:MAG TPA: SEC-C metal-binding domain-containing protein, partial [Candidatus Izemoplasmatales bacterium]|nr:SEC-C metal-binding domain-containing protein [Candidatus Izemoplasmatales bacterium]
TDIKLGQGVKALGGLAVIGTERHESRRIDNQLRGRSGRQGDPGYSRFFLSADDDLLKRFGSDRFKRMIEMINGKGKNKEAPLDFKMFSKLVLRAQRQIEGNNYDRRKTVLQYDEILKKQRDIIYKQRTDVLFLDNIEESIDQMILSTIGHVVQSHQGDFEELTKSIHNFFGPQLVDLDILETESDPHQYLVDVYEKDKAKKREMVGEKTFNDFLKSVTLRVVDTHWVQHIDAMSELRQAVRLQSYGQNNPFREFQEAGFSMFETMVSNIQNDVTRYVLRAQVRQNTERVQVAKPVSTYSGKEDESSKRKPVTKKKTVGRNDPCPCGSGKKYKHCHGRNG